MEKKRKTRFFPLTQPLRLHSSQCTRSTCRLVGLDRLTLNDRTHFFAVAAKLMRQILVDHARRKRADKRGGGATMMTLNDVAPASQASMVDVIALDQALDALCARDARQCRVVELRFFAGLSIDETAQAIGVSPATDSRRVFERL